ncbi:hypothetical protein [Desulforamulus ruminis]|uniref:RNA polymerase, sigma 32 subunit, RpoH n=1 Tax=Desulforamulus ruminis (strain ATCC 23193 / DSM 2154 / NCIMB 8452 / DL) TaxID=696281 RepID=F6DNX1_DESRL|nr:hypothetical protein [Desulforamulus ruminis]AEG60690.1 RNA polymerase, sigma 32 subunit, RpoH [Desulforamulus ruminis DSM 2154]
MKNDYDWEKVLKIAANLNKKDFYIFKLRMGFINNKTHSIREISLLLNMPLNEVLKELRRIEKYVLSEYHKNYK